MLNVLHIEIRLISLAWGSMMLKLWATFEIDSYLRIPRGHRLAHSKHEIVEKLLLEQVYIEIV